MKVLLCLHHRLGIDSGAPGATLALGAALGTLGYQVDYLSFDEVFGALDTELVSHQLLFPWRAALELGRQASHFDLIDASTGDAWLWASLVPGVRRPALVTRAHGLEHVAHVGAQRAAREYGQRLSWKYPLYHGGYRLWEVRRSLRVADHCVMLNGLDRDHARDRLGIPAEKLSVLPNGIRDNFALVPDVDGPGDGPVRLAFVGTWVPLKGTAVLASALAQLDDEGLNYELTLLGTREQEGILAALPERARGRTRLIPTYHNHELPDLLAGSEILMAPSRSEGSSVALLEAMACGAAPVATRVGAAEDVIEPARSGILVEPGDADALARAVLDLSADRARLARMRRAAQETARAYRWRDVAARTGRLYERVLAERVRTAA